jgi:hypothetical protein
MADVPVSAQIRVGHRAKRDQSIGGRVSMDRAPCAIALRDLRMYRRRLTA